MPVKNPFLLYLRSRLNSVLSLATAFMVVLALVFLRPYALVPIAVILLSYAALTGVLFFSRRGAREVVAESEEDRRKQIARKIDASAETRERIAVLRIGDERMAKAIEYFLQESGSYLEKSASFRATRLLPTSASGASWRSARSSWGSAMKLRPQGDTA